jgi:hypothetical protein
MNYWGCCRRMLFLALQGLSAKTFVLDVASAHLCTSIANKRLPSELNIESDSCHYCSHT